jgi:hypothetical protein
MGKNYYRAEWFRIVRDSLTAEREGGGFFTAEGDGQRRPLFAVAFRDIPR